MKNYYFYSFKILTKFFLVSSVFLFSSLRVFSETTKLKASVSYNLAADQKFKIRITQIPKKYPWIERDIERNVKVPSVGSLIVAENIEDVLINDKQGDLKIIPEGSKFYAKVKSFSDRKYFNKDANTVLEFFAVEIDEKQIEFDEKFILNSDQKKAFKDKASKIASVGFYGIGGALAGPLIAYSLVNNISSLGSIGLSSNPYFLASSAGLGATAGLAYGIIRKGKHNKLQPGLELDLTLKEAWFFQLLEDLPNALVSESLDMKPEEKLIDIKIHKIKKTRNIFGDKSLLLDFTYKNFTDENLRYSNFKLVDSMNKEYEPFFDFSFDSEYDEFLPKESRLKLYFSVDFVDTKHTLKILRTFDQKPLASLEFFLK